MKELSKLEYFIGSYFVFGIIVTFFTIVSESTIEANPNTIYNFWGYLQPDSILTMFLKIFLITTFFVFLFGWLLGFLKKEDK